MVTWINNKVPVSEIDDHGSEHEDEGLQEINLEGLSGDPADTINESLLTTQNDIIVRGASIAERLAIGASRIVARLAAGNVVAATIQQILNLLMTTQNDIITRNGSNPIRLNIGASRIVARLAAGNLVAATAAQILALLSGQAAAAFNWNNQELDDIKTLNLSSGTELTISSGVVTATQGHHSIDTEGNAATDDLLTINGLEGNDLLFIFAADDDRTIRLVNGDGNIFLGHVTAEQSYNFNSPQGSSGTFYIAGDYDWPSMDANLNQGSTTVTHGGATGAYASHAGLVAGGAGSASAGTVSIVVSGVSIDDDGNRNGSDSETIVADITAMTLNQYFETTKKWLGTVTYTLTPSAGGTFSADFNYGHVKYEDLGNTDFNVTLIEFVGRAGANDTGFNLRLIYHNSADWTYAASGFVPGPTAGDASELANMNTDYSTEQNLVNGDHFAYKRVNINQDVNGSDSEGLLVEITTSANRAVESMDCHIGYHGIPKYFYLGAATQHALFMKHGSAWHQV